VLRSEGIHLFRLGDDFGRWADAQAGEEAEANTL
jgi:hypothetical protein